ncbi:heterodisulfide reductase-related iron-sulfur binding cluster [Mobilicoccus caccae]|nr:heterodisulfide reductase-related iron-sulfur binding cluster [Mobilicoccus caccae]
MDSPRGRIHLMTQTLEGGPLTDTVVGHFDACLGCMACVTACPSGVQYDKLIEATRAQVERNHRRSPQDRALRSAIFSLFPYPRRLRAVTAPLKLYQRTGLGRLVRRSKVLDRISPQLAAMEALAPPLGAAEPVAHVTPAVGPRRGRVGMLLGCVQREFLPGVNAATVRVLTAEGYDVVAPREQGCCGALSVHVGREEEGCASRAPSSTSSSASASTTSSSTRPGAARRSRTTRTCSPTTRSTPSAPRHCRRAVWTSASSSRRWGRRRPTTRCR